MTSLILLEIYMWHFKVTPRSKQSLWRNGKAPLTLMLNQHLMAFLGSALAHVWSTGEPSGWKHPCKEIYCPVKGWWLWSMDRVTVRPLCPFRALEVFYSWADRFRPSIQSLCGQTAILSDVSSYERQFMCRWLLNSLKGQHAFILISSEVHLMFIMSVYENGQLFLVSIFHSLFFDSKS